MGRSGNGMWWEQMLSSFFCRFIGSCYFFSRMWGLDSKRLGWLGHIFCDHHSLGTSRTRKKGYFTLWLTVGTHPTDKSGRRPLPLTPAHTACVMGLVLWEGIFKAFSSVSTYMLPVSMLPETGHFYSFLLLGQQQSLLRQSVLGYRVIACSADVLPSKCPGVASGKCKPPNF